ncbi:hypothetical protein EDD22DRAFT_731637, partial [Suillus occidentalis]
MDNQRISNDLKDRTLQLWDHGWDLEDICEAQYCHKAPFSTHRGVLEQITRALLMAVEHLFVEDSDLFLDEVCTWLAIEHDIIISTSTLSCNLKDAGLT